MKPSECPECSMLAFRYGRCGHCGYEDDTATDEGVRRRWDHPGWPDERQRQIGRQRIAEIKKKYFYGKGEET